MHMDVGSSCLQTTKSVCTPKFLEFLKKHDIDSKIYEDRLKYRFIRLHPSLIPGEDFLNEDPFKRVNLDVLKNELSPELVFIENSGGFCRIPALTSLSSSKMYKEGKIYGMDFSSGSAVLALGIQKGDKILELCCAPGAKLCMMSDLLSIKEYSCDKFFNSGSITGVDISEHRLFTCRALIKKYKTAHRTRLFHADATLFGVLPPKDLRFVHNKSSKDIQEKENALVETMRESEPAIKRSKASVDFLPFFAPRHFRSPSVSMSPELSHSSEGYDKVLVDAECTHDGSITHVIKYSLGKSNEPKKDGKETIASEGIDSRTFNLEKFDAAVLDDEKLAELSSLQLRLLNQGYRLLRPGGVLVYSTCSLTIDQNEGVIARFAYDHFKDQSTPIPEPLHDFLPSSISTANPKYLASLLLESYGIPLEHHEYVRNRASYAIRFDPIVSGTSGLFISRFSKPNAKDFLSENSR